MCSPPPTCTERSSENAANLIVAGGPAAGKGQKMDWGKLLRDSPDDTLLRLAYADWLEERGEDDKARAHREIVRRGWKPADATEAGKTVPWGESWDDAWLWVLARNSRQKMCGWTELAKRRGQYAKAVLPRKLFRTYARLAWRSEPPESVAEPAICEAFGVKDKWRAYEILALALVQLQQKKKVDK